MTYSPTPETASLLDTAYGYVQSVPYAVTARWVFYRLLQDGHLNSKADYKRLLGYLSKARKEFYGPWRPDTLADDTRVALLRGDGFESPAKWLSKVVESLRCNLDRWQGQRNYVEVWFEAAAMQAQFKHYCDPNVTLLAFHGDVSIPAKWDAARRVFQALLRDKQIKVFYFGDLDPKGIQIPISAQKDIEWFVGALIAQHMPRDSWETWADKFGRSWGFTRVGINEEHVDEYEIPENPERPGTYQWEGLSDEGAAELISTVDDYLDKEAFEAVAGLEAAAARKVSEYLAALDLSDIGR